MTENMRISNKIYKARKAIRKRVYDLLLYLEELDKTDLTKNEKRALHQDIEFHQKFLTEAIFFDSEKLYRDHILWYNEKTPSNEQKKYKLFNIILAFHKLFREWLPDSEFEVVDEFIQYGFMCLENKHTYLSKTLTASNPYKKEANEYSKILLENNRIKARNYVFDLFDKGVSIIDIYRYILRGGLRIIGYLWQTNKINIAKEHIATNITECIERELYFKAVKKPSNGVKALIASIGNEKHYLGVKMISNILELNGFETYFLGETIPSSDLYEMINEIKPDVILISTTMAFNLNNLYKTIQFIKEKYNTPIIVGGYALNVDLDLWKKLNCDGYALNIHELLEVMSELFPDINISPKSEISQ